MTARTITTAAELDALHDERVLLEASGSYRYGSGTFEECWVRPVPPWITGTTERVWEVLVHGDEAPLSLVHTEDLDLPVTVLVDPSAPSEATAAVVTPPAMRIEGTWLVEVVDEHTCGAGPGSGTGMHEPGCGLVPVLDLATLPGWDEHLTAAPSATRDEVARALEGEFGCFLARDPHRPDAFWGGAADALLDTLD